MSILINGVGMPKDCSGCYLSIYYDGYNRGYGYCTPGYRCRPLKRLIEEDKIKRNYYPRPSDCPLVEIPTPHGKLIDADRLITGLKNIYLNPSFFASTLTMGQIEHLIKYQLTIIEAEE